MGNGTGPDTGRSADAPGAPEAGRPAPDDLLTVASVAPPLPVPGLFSYAVPDALRSRVVPGVRAEVTFGGRRLTAMVVAVERGPPPERALQPLLNLVDAEPLAGADILRLGTWLARSLGCSVGEALDAALPRAARTGRTGRTIEEVRMLVDADRVGEVVEELQGKREKQARTLRILADRGGVLPVRELMGLAHVSRSPVQSLARSGHVALGRVRAAADPLLGRSVERQPPRELTPDQQVVHDRILEVVEAAWAAGPREAGTRSPADEPVRTLLLHGVTGSGKTEVYLQCLDHVVRAGRQGIVLVPEISLTPQTVRRFRERFDRVAVLHSHLTDAERHDQWRSIRRGEADVVIGARSAVFAPVPRLGLVVLDEEHETSFKQQNVPRYHAREVAVERARLAGAVTLLGTATPSLEAFQRARDGQYERLVLNERVAGGRSPELVLVDLGVEERRKNLSFLSDSLRAAMEDALSREGQVLLFLNRRGWAPVLLCRTCRATLKCPGCDVSMTLHQRIGRVLCHYCGHEEPPPAACAACGQRLAPLGFGTEKVEQEVRHAFPGAHVARMDSDTMSGRGAHEKVLDAFSRGEVDVLVGTQMIAKGLDFPDVVLVGVICADSALFLPDYRASERTFQLLAQVTGRTGRGPKGGRVVVQAYNPRHIAVRTGMAQDYDAFARHELAEREALGYPPFGRLLRIVVQGPDEAAVQARAAALGRRLRGEEEPADGESLFVLGGGTPPGRPGVFVLGPAPAPIPRINRQHRVHLVAKCGDDADVEALLTVLEGHTQPVRRVRVLVDVDPLSML